MLLLKSGNRENRQEHQNNDHRVDDHAGDGHVAHQISHRHCHFPESKLSQSCRKLLVIFQAKVEAQYVSIKPVQ